MSSYGEANPIVCAHEGCDKKIKSSSWSVIKAEGWFHQRDGISWCPDHNPEWVAAWREKNKRV